MFASHPIRRLVVTADEHVACQVAENQEKLLDGPVVVAATARQMEA